MEDLFRSGTLEMSDSPVAGLAADPLWTDLTVNRALAVLAVLLAVVSLRGLFQLTPHLLYCYDRARGAETLEHSLGMARIRNLLALALILPFSLVLDRWAVVQPACWDAIPDGWNAVCTVALVCAFVLVRALLYLIFRPRRLSSEAVATLRHNLYNYLPLAVLLLLITTAVLVIGKLPDETGRTLIRWEIAAVWGFFLLRSAQFLGAQRSGFSTFLYLCALEILPAAMLVAVIIVF